MKKWLKRLKKDERGLTLVELLAVVVILAIVAAIAFISIGNVMENSKKDAHIANAQQVISAAKLYEASGGEITETGITAGVAVDEEGDTIDGALDTLEELINPWDKNPYTGEVSKKDGEYTVTLEATNCSIEHTETQLRTLDRKDICTSGGDTE